MTRQALRILSRSKIDAIKWDNCVNTSAHPRLYALSWYLDIVCHEWFGVIYREYEAVFPVPVNQRWGISYIEQPLFTQQLGLFGSASHYDLLPSFLAVVKKRFKLCSHYNMHSGISGSCTTGTDLLLLDKEYADLVKDYRRDRKYRLRKMNKQPIDTRHLDTIQPMWEMFESTVVDKFTEGVHPDSRTILEKLHREISERLETYLVYTEEQNTKVKRAGVWFVKYQNSWIYLFNAASPEARKADDRTVLIDAFIQSQAGSGSVLDFESPLEPSPIREFYQSFGAKHYPVEVLSYNNLPRWVNAFWWLKRKLS